jgi:transcriptional regulator with XRE-family HTH domain
MRMVRTSAHLRQGEMAEAPGVSWQAPTQYESGNRTPPYRVLERAGEEFGIDGSWLLLGRPNSAIFWYSHRGER